MLKRLLRAGISAGTFVAFATLSTVSASAAPEAHQPPSSPPGFAHVCATPAHGLAACNVILRTDAKGSGTHGGGGKGGKGGGGGGGGGTSGPAGYQPADLQSAYALASAAASSGSGQTVAIVDAYDDPNAEADLAVYRSTFGLPACTTSNGCFRKVDQAGGTSYPAANSSWAVEISLDLDMVSAICPNCHLLLVEANSGSFSNLGTAVNTAVGLGATEVSLSWGGSDNSDASYGNYFNHPGVPITASAGDSGYGVQYPASSQYVTAVGGTTLTRSSNTRGWSETAWSGTGSGCSAYNPQPSWQAAANTGCSDRAVADVSADADPNTGVALYDTYGQGGWLVAGGTSVASPIVAAVYALAGNGSSTSYGSYPYAHSSSLWDVTSGSNTTSGCSPSQLCTAGSGWDGPTGLGTPDGTGAF